MHKSYSQWDTALGCWGHSSGKRNMMSSVLQQLNCVAFTMRQMGVAGRYNFNPQRF